VSARVVSLFTSTRVVPTVDSAEPSTLAWHVNPWREHPRGARLATACWCAGGMLLAALHVPMVTFLALFAAWTLSLGPALFPTECRLDGRGLGVRTLIGWRRLEWRDVRRARVGNAGLFASPFLAPSWRERFRAMRLDVPRDAQDRTALLDQLRERLTAHGL